MIQDLDTWVLAISDSADDYEPLALIELKRSSISPHEWKPFKDDLPNYMALYRLSEKAELPLWIIYFTKEFKRIALFKILSVNSSSSNWISYEKIVLTPDEFKQQFESLF